MTLDKTVSHQVFSFENDIYELALEALDRFKDYNLKAVVSSELHLAAGNVWVDIIETL